MSVVAVVVAIIGFFAGISYRKSSAEKKIGSAEEKAKRILSDAINNAEQKKKETILEAKEEVLKLKQENDRELKERRNDIKAQEKRIQQKEEQLQNKENNLDKKMNNLELKEEKLQEKNKILEEKINECEVVKRSQMEILEKLSGLSKEQAKAELLKSLDEQLDHEKAVHIMEYERATKDRANELATNILSCAVQRCAADHSNEITVTSVELPNDDIKGRIIGREGRNIRAIEAALGVDLIIDDTPEIITVSCFEPVRREIARITLEKLIADGRIHPGKIEEMVAKATNEVETVIKKEGDRAVIEAGVHGLHPEIVKLLGKLHYRTSYGQNVLTHSLEVSHICGLLATELGVDINLAKRAGLLHDIGKAIDHEQEGTHTQLGVEFIKKYKENEQIIHAIAAHHGDIEAKSALAFIVQAADAVSAARPGARRENIENYIKRLEKLEEISSSFNGVASCYAIQAGREVRVLVKPEVVSDDKLVILARDIARRIEAELEYPGQIKVNIIRESRASDIAK